MNQQNAGPRASTEQVSYAYRCPPAFVYSLLVQRSERQNAH
jgi:hypothetical protein